MVIIRSHGSDGSQRVAMAANSPSSVMKVMVWLLSKVMTAILLACLFWFAHTDIRLVTMQVPVEFLSALTLMFFKQHSTFKATL
jgi:hypothetical protein